MFVFSISFKSLHPSERWQPEWYWTKKRRVSPQTICSPDTQHYNNIQRFPRSRVAFWVQLWFSAPQDQQPQAEQKVQQLSEWCRPECHFSQYLQNNYGPAECRIPSYTVLKRSLQRHNIRQDKSKMSKLFSIRTLSSGSLLNLSHIVILLFLIYAAHETIYFTWVLLSSGIFHHCMDLTYQLPRINLRGKGSMRLKTGLCSLNVV